MKFLRLLIVSCLLLMLSGIKAQYIDTTRMNSQQLNNLRNQYNTQYPRTDTSKRDMMMRNYFGKIDTSRLSHYYIDTTQLKKYPPGRIYGQDLFRNKNIKFFNNATQTMAADNYILGVGDVINISIWGFAEYNDVFQIGNEGFIEPKYIGRVYVKGLKFGEAKEILIKKFSGATDLKNSRIDIILNYSKVINVNIVGEVYNPGTYTIPAMNTVFNALIAASGPTQIGSVRHIYLKRNNKIVDSLDVYKFLTDPDSKNDIYLENNDYIIVGTAKKVATIIGEINRPFMYELKGTETINSLIKYAGGLTPFAYRLNVQVRRYTNNKSEMININLDSLKEFNQDFIINNGDQVFIDRISEELTNFVTATGAVKIPGSYQFKEGDKIEDILKKAQGLTYDAYLHLAYIVRIKDDLTKKYISINLSNVLSDKNSPDNIQLEKFDTLKVLSQNDFIDIFKVSVIGAVRKPGDFSYGDNLTLKDVLTMSGGLKPEAVNNRIEISRIIDYDKTDNKIVPIRAIVNTIQIGNDLSISQEAKNFILQPYDQIYVRSNPDFLTPKKVFVSGEVMYPGVYALLRKDETVAEVIKRAGGLTKFAFLGGVTMSTKYNGTGLVYLNLEKALKNQHSKYNIVLNDSDMINVPKTIDMVHISGSIGMANFQNISTSYYGNSDFQKVSPSAWNNGSTLTGISNSTNNPQSINNNQKGNINNNSINNPVNNNIAALTNNKPGNTTNNQSNNNTNSTNTNNNSNTNNNPYNNNNPNNNNNNPGYNNPNYYNNNPGYNNYNPGYNNYNPGYNNYYQGYNNYYPGYNNYYPGYNNYYPGFNNYNPAYNNAQVKTNSMPVLANFQSISIPYFPNKRAKFYVKHYAGGFSKEAQKARTYVVYPNGIVKSTKDFWIIRRFPRVKNGSDIHVPYKNEMINKNNQKKIPVDWNKVIENTTVKLTGILTLWLLITKINQ